MTRHDMTTAQQKHIHINYEFLAFLWIMQLACADFSFLYLEIVSYNLTVMSAP